MKDAEREEVSGAVGGRGGNEVVEGGQQLWEAGAQLQVRCLGKASEKGHAKAAWSALEDSRKRALLGEGEASTEAVWRHLSGVFK